MIKYEGLNYDLDSLLEFHVLKKLLEALLNKQKLYDIILYGKNFENITSSNEKYDNNINFKSEFATPFGLLKEFEESQDKLKENKKMIDGLKKRIENLEKTINTFKNKSNENLNEKMESNIENKNTEINNSSNNEQKNQEEKINEMSKKESIEEKKENNENTENNENKENIEREEEKSDKNSNNLIVEEFLKKCENNQKYINILKQNENELTQKIKTVENQISDLNQKMTNLNDNNNRLFEILEKKITKMVDSKIKEDSNSKFNNFIFEYNKEKERVNSIISKNITDFINLNRKHNNLEKVVDNIPNKLNIKYINEQIESLNTAIEDSVDKKEISFFVGQFNKYEKEINKLNTYKAEQEKTESKLKEQMTVVENTLNNFKRNISSLNSLLGNRSLAEILEGINKITTKMVDIDDYNKKISLINKTASELKMEVNDHNRSIDVIKEKMENMLTKKDFEKMENKTNELISKQNSDISEKYVDKKNIQKNMNSIKTQIKTIMTEISKEKEKEKINTCMLSSKPVDGFKCASCDTYIGEIKESFQYLPWNKYPILDNNKPYNIGSGYSRVLESMNIEHLKYSSHNKVDKTKNFSLIDNVDENSISLEKSIEEKKRKHKKFMPMLRVVSTRNLKSLKELPFNTEQKFNLQNPIADADYSQSIYNNAGIKKNLKSINTIVFSKTKDSYYNKKIDKSDMKTIKNNMQ